MKKIFIIAAVVFLIVLGLGIYRFNFTNDDMYNQDGTKIGLDNGNISLEATTTEPNIVVNITTTNNLTEKEARRIAEKACIKQGESLSSSYYNPNSKTWWFDANIKTDQQGCNPACVVDTNTKTAEINWRCTGLITPPPVVVCTMDAKQCPDGSYVGRSGPNCDFVCPK